MLTDEYLEELLTWRRQSEERLRAEDGWLAVVGLDWLAQGENTLGAGVDNAIVLPAGSAPGRVGLIRYDGQSASLEVAGGVTVTVEGQPVTQIELKPDVSGEPTVLHVNDLILTLIRRDDLLGLRVRDRNSAQRLEFPGRRWYDPDEAFRFRARFVPYDPPRTVEFINELDQHLKEETAGYLAFEFKGAEYRLDPLPSDDLLFLMFLDATSDGETYPSGRYMYLENPQNGYVDLDFNRAYSPPCAFTDFATCALPPSQNRLPFPVRAGEKYHKDK
jgi:hypothetical protein